MTALTTETNDVRDGTAELSSAMWAQGLFWLLVPFFGGCHAGAALELGWAPPMIDEDTGTPVNHDYRVPFKFAARSPKSWCA